MKILLAQKLTYVPTLSGAGKGNRFLLEELAMRKHSCRVLALAQATGKPQGRKQWLHELAVRGIRVASISSAVDVFSYNGVEVHAITEAPRFCAYLMEQIRQFEPTWTLVSEDRTYLTLAAALEARPSRVVYLCHSQATLPFGPECFLMDSTRADLLRKVTGIITVSSYLREYIARWGGIESTVMPFPTYGSGPFPYFGNFHTGFVTMVNPSKIKGVSIFVELARKLPDIGFAAVPTWATTDADCEALERIPNIRLLRPSDDIDEIFARTRIVLVPSLWGEAFGKIAVEAMLRGIPVVASNVGGLPEAKLGVDYLIPVRPIERYEEGADDRLLPVPLVPEQDIGPWLKALGALISDRAHYERVSAASREAALRYVSGLTITSFEDYLEGLAPVALAGAHNGIPLQKIPENLSPERLELLALLLRRNIEVDL